MAWFSKKTDPISDRARALNDEIAHLEAEIKRLDSQLKRTPPPRLRSTAVPHRGTVSHAGTGASTGARPAHAPSEPIFEEVDQDRLTGAPEAATTPEHYNELGVRKYDLHAFLLRLRNHFRGPSTTNPKLVNYLAAGGIQGLRPLRYEKRVARNRIIAFAVFLFLIALGVFVTYVKHSR